MKILILGATGMAGHTITYYFKERGHHIVAFSRLSLPGFENIIGDVFNVEKLKKLLLKENYDVVINCIGILNQDAELNPANAVYLNSYLPHLIINILKEKNTKLIHMSTDCVFAGNTGPYFEDSFRDGHTFYDRSKALGEINDRKNLTFRNSIIGPDMYKKGIGLFNWFMQQKGTIKGFKGAIWTGVTTLTLAKAMEKAIEEDLCGLYLLVNNEHISKFNLLEIFNKYFRDNNIIIQTDNKFILDKTLINKRHDFSFEIPSYEQMIFEMKDWIYKHPLLYPHYQINK